MTRSTLSNGLTVLYRQDKSFPLAYATLLLGVGSRDEQQDQAGLCSMTVDLLMQGTRQKNARELARVMESVGASIGTQVHEDYSEVGFVVPAAELERAFGIMTEVLREPSFPKGEIVQEKAHVLAGLASRKDAIFNLAYDHLTAALYGSHAYGRPVEGTAKAIEKFRRSDIQEWHQRFLRPEKAILSLMGPMPARDALRLVEKYLGRWQKTSPRKSFIRGPVALMSTPLDPGLRSAGMTIPSTFKQAYLMSGWQAPAASDDNQVPLKVLNTLLGGGMSSRLFVTLRENLGLAYEISSFYPTRLDLSHWVIYLGLPEEKLTLASRKLEELLQTLAARGPVAGELAQAKMMIRGAFLMDRQSRRRQTWYQAWWEFLDRGAGYGGEFLRAVDAVTPKQVQNLLKKILDQPRVTVRVVPK